MICNIRTIQRHITFCIYLNGGANISLLLLIIYSLAHSYFYLKFGTTIIVSSGLFVAYFLHV